MLFARSGRTPSLHYTQGDALGYVLVAPSGRIMNVCAYSAVRAGFLEGGVEIGLKVIYESLRGFKGIWG